MNRSNRIETIFIAIGVATIVGLLYRVGFGMNVAGLLFTVMSLSFILCVPLLMGFITVYLLERKQLYTFGYVVFTPWLSIFTLFLITVVISLEGWVCWVMILPIFLIVSSFGGLWAHRVRKRQNKNRLQLSLVLLLPFILSPVENWIGARSQPYRAYTEIEIHASKERIWQNVTRVKTIDKHQDSAKFTRFLGFPRPIRAELDTNAVGGKRKAIFDKGLIFNEQVIAYEPEKLMRFTITANPYEIPSTTMDKHIVVGGEYFDVLQGTYELEQVGSNTYKLHLYSDFKLHTTFNFYAGIWAKWIMKDIQQNILKVIKQRSESSS